MGGFRIVESDFSQITAYESVPLRFEGSSRLDLTALNRGELVAIEVWPFCKDYDRVERPSSLPLRFDVSAWGVLAALESSGESAHSQIGGAIIAWNTPGVEMLEGRDDLAVLWDIRVATELHGKGVGRGLFEAAASWSRVRRCSELRVETQDNNVAACRFYAAMGCTVHSIERGAYGVRCYEAKIVWTSALAQ